MLNDSFKKATQKCTGQLKFDKDHSRMLQAGRQPTHVSDTVHTRFLHSLTAVQALALSCGCPALLAADPCWLSLPLALLMPGFRAPTHNTPPDAELHSGLCV